MAKGGKGNDVIFGNGGDDLLIGGAGKDLLFGSADGNQTFIGGKGNDKIFLNGGTDTVILRAGEGTDKIYGFDLGNTSLGLSEGLSFDSLSFKQGRGFSAIINGHTTLAKVVGVSVDALNSESNFTTV
ncbi:MAG: hypothetical protein AAGC93_12510 [Cyanobacteria bacterium P01_F01_bin.53]